MRVEELIETGNVTAEALQMCDPFVLSITCYYPSGSGTEKRVHKGKGVKVYPYCRINYIEAAEAINNPSRFAAKFQFKSGIPDW